MQDCELFQRPGSDLHCGRFSPLFLCRREKRTRKLLVEGKEVLDALAVVAA